VRTYAYSSTHRLVEVGDGQLLKKLGPGGRMQDVYGRPSWLDDPAREPAAYRHVLGPLGIGPRCDASGPDWVLLERVRVPVLWQIGDVTVWTAVARWLGHLHRALARVDIDKVPVVELDAASFVSWRARAADTGVPEHILDAHVRAADLLLAMPPTTIHGDLYPSNVLVDPGPPVTVWPVDWELIGRGPAVLDLAAITSGAWNVDERAAMVSAYAEAAAPGVRRRLDAALDAARLHLCVQWLGVPREWPTPPEHAHDWMSEALELAVRL
jgi:hypothetical protein